MSEKEIRSAIGAVIAGCISIVTVIYVTVYAPLNGKAETIAEASMKRDTAQEDKCLKRYLDVSDKIDKAIKEQTLSNQQLFVMMARLEEKISK